MHNIVHRCPRRDLAEPALNRCSIGTTLALTIWAAIAAGPVVGQVTPGGPGGLGRPSLGGPSSELLPDSPASDKPEAAARKAYVAGMKSMSKAQGYESAAAAAQNSDKRAAALEKMGDSLNRALDQFTEALSNKGDMVEAWDKVGFIHLRLGAFAESVDDYDHTLALRPDLLEAVMHRGEAYLALGRLDGVKGAYMELFNHARPLADQLFPAMQKWLNDHRIDSNGMRAADIDGFDQWLRERDGIAKQTAALPP